MLRSPWLRTACKPTSRAGRRFRPALEALEERTLLSAATHLVFANEPPDTTIGVPFAPTVTVYAEDASNQIDTSYAGAITVALGSNPGNATLGGTTTQSAIAGVATFSDLTLDTAGTGYTLVAQANDLAVPPMGLTINLGDGKTYGELAVESFSWGVANPNGSAPAVQDFQVQVDPSLADPGLWSAAATGKRFVSATLDVRSGESTSQEYLTYTFTNVLVSSYSVPANGNTVDLALRFGAMQETYQSSNGPVSAAINRGTSKVTSDVPTGGVPPTPAFNQLSLADLGNDLPVLSYAWGVSNAGTAATGAAGAGKASFQDFTVTVAPTASDPLLWAAVAQHRVGGPTATVRTVPSATLNLGIDPVTNLPLDSYSFTNVLVTAYATDGNAITLTLHFGAVTQTDATGNGPVTGSVDTKGRITYSVPPAGATQNIAADVLDLAGIGNNLPVKSYSWGLANSASLGTASKATSAGKASFQAFTVTLAPTPLDPALWAVAAGGKNISTATLLFGIDPQTQTPAQTYTFSTLRIKSYTTDGDSITLTLVFASVTEEESTANGLVSATVNLTRGTSVSTVVPEGGVPEVPAASLLNLPGVGSAVPIQSYAWGVTHPAGSIGATRGGAAGKLTVDTFQFTLPVTALSPLLWAAAATGKHLASATFTSDTDPNTQQPVETFTFSDVLISGYTTDGNTIGLTLTFGKLTDAYPIPGDTVSATLDRTGSRTTVSTHVPTQPVPENSGTDLLDLAGLGNNVPVESYSWGATNSGSALNSTGGAASAGTTSVNAFSITLAPTALAPLLWATAADGTLLASATLTIRSPIGDGRFATAATFSFTDLFITRFATDGNAITLTLSFATLMQSDPADSAAVSAALDLRHGQPTTTVTDGTVPESAALVQLSMTGIGSNIPVDSYSWAVNNPTSSATGGAGAGKVKFSELQITLPPTALDPALWAAVTRGTHIGTATLTISPSLTASQPQQTYTLGQVLISAYATDNGELTLNLSYVTIQQDYSPLLADGTLGSAVSASWNLQTARGTGNLVLPPVPVFTVVSTPFTANNPVPKLASLGTSTAVEGSGTLTIAVNGSGFVAGSLVMWNGTALATTYVSAAQLMAVVPAALVAEEGTAAVAVTSPGPGGGPSAKAQTFTITDAPLQAQGLTVVFLANAPSTNVAVATFQDGNPFAPLSDFTATINWGDQTTSVGTIAVAANGTFYVLGTHTYSQSLTGGSERLPISVQIDDDGGQSASVTSTAIVSP